MPSGIITLLTDFGMEDTYSSIMKGVILRINPHANLIDLTHKIPPHNILTGAFLLNTTWQNFPPGTIHIAVVDPGVGSSRKAILVEKEKHIFLAPDNGLLSLILPSESHSHLVYKTEKNRTSKCKTYELTNTKYWNSSVSSTFHGRDIFAPVAAHLSLGVSLSDLGNPIQGIKKLPIPTATIDKNLVLGHVLHVDTFGNIISNIPGAMIEKPNTIITITIKGNNISWLSPNYASGKGLTALIGSHEYLEIALPNKSAAEYLAISRGDQILVKISSST